MTLELKDALTREMNDAMEAGDEKRINRAQNNMLIAMLDCQAKMAQRVKRIQWIVFTLLTGGVGAVGLEAKFEILKMIFH